MMKIKIVIIIALFVVIGCTTSKKQSDQTDENKNVVPVLNLRSYSGEWVNVKYLRSVRKTRSAKASQYASSFSSIIIKNDSAFFNYAFHEGSEYQINNDAIGFYCKTYLDSIRFAFTNDMLIVSSGVIKDTLVRYQMSPPQSAKYYSNLLLNKEIFAGEYRTVEFPHNKIVFTKDGYIGGIKNYRTYFVADDYCDAGCQYDIIYMQVNPEDRFEYTWTFSRDTLNIYDLDCLEYDSLNYDCQTTKIGKLVCRLVKN